jgi:hypothetical protein
MGPILEFWMNLCQVLTMCWLHRMAKNKASYYNRIVQGFSD